MNVELETVEQRFEAEAPASLIAVCGVGGGVGTSTMAFLTAMHVQRFASSPILLCDTGGPAASLSVLAEKGSQLSLPQAAAAIGADALAVPLFVQLSPKLRLIARPPDFDDFLDPGGLARLLHDARSAHPVTIVDCGSLQRPVERSVAEQASSILWVAYGSPLGARRAHAALQALSLNAEREILAVRAGEVRDSAAEHDLMNAAGRRNASLVFVPTLPEMSRASLGAALQGGHLALEAIRMRLT